MALSNMRIVSDGTLAVVDISFDYFEQSEISVFFDSVPQTTGWAWGSSRNILFTPPVPAGVEVLIQRKTDAAVLRHEFSKGASFTADTLDEDLRQVLHIVQEATESNFSKDFFDDINMNGFTIKNVRPAVADNEVVTLGDVKQQSATAWQAAAQAEASRNNAEAWATSPTDVTTGKASSKTYSERAAASASAASASASSANTSAGIATSAAFEAEQHRDSAASSASSAYISADRSEAKAAEAAASAAAAASYDPAPTLAAVELLTQEVQLMPKYFGNKLRNGKMEIAQAGTSFAVAAGASNARTLDGWFVTNGTGGALTASQQSDPPTPEFLYSLRCVVNTPDTAMAASEFAMIAQPIEGTNVRDLIGRPVLVQFYVRSPKAGVHCVALRNSGADRSYVLEYTVNSPNTWELKTLYVPNGLITAGDWNWTNGVGLFLSFAMAAGTSRQTTKDAWQTGNFIATANQVNCLDTAGAVFAISGVLLSVGTKPVPYPHRAYQEELINCQRYYEVLEAESIGYGAGGALAGSRVQYKVNKRVPGNVTLTRTYTFNAAATSSTSLVTPTGVTVVAVVTNTGLFSTSDRCVVNSDLL